MRTGLRRTLSHAASAFHLPSRITPLLSSLNPFPNDPFSCIARFPLSRITAYLSSPLSPLSFSSLHSTLSPFPSLLSHLCSVIVPLSSIISPLSSLRSHLSPFTLISLLSSPIPPLCDLLAALSSQLSPISPLISHIFSLSSHVSPLKAVPSPCE